MLIIYWILLIALQKYIYNTEQYGCELKTTQRPHLLLVYTFHEHDGGNALNSLPTNCDQITN